MATKKVDLKPIGRAIEQARNSLEELAEKASRAERDKVRERIKELNLMLKQVPYVCRDLKSRKPPLFTTALCSGKPMPLLKPPPAFTISVSTGDPDREKQKKRK